MHLIQKWSLEYLLVYTESKHLSLLGLTGEMRVEERGPLMHNLVKNMYTHIMHPCSLKSFMLTLQRFPVLVIGPGFMFYILSKPLFSTPFFVSCIYLPMLLLLLSRFSCD